MAILYSHGIHGMHDFAVCCVFKTTSRQAQCKAKRTTHSTNHAAQRIPRANTSMQGTTRHYLHRNQHRPTSRSHQHTSSWCISIKASIKPPSIVALTPTLTLALTLTLTFTLTLSRPSPSPSVSSHSYRSSAPSSRPRGCPTRCPPPSRASAPRCRSRCELPSS